MSVARRAPLCDPSTVRRTERRIGFSLIWDMLGLVRNTTGKWPHDVSGAHRATGLAIPFSSTHAHRGGHSVLPHARAQRRRHSVLSHTRTAAAILFRRYVDQRPRALRRPFRAGWLEWIFLPVESQDSMSVPVVKIGGSTTRWGCSQIRSVFSSYERLDTEVQSLYRVGEMFFPSFTRQNKAQLANTADPILCQSFTQEELTILLASFIGIAKLWHGL